MKVLENPFRWYYDKELANCFEYFYEGCGGGRNTFYDDTSCRRICIPADKQKCGGNAKPMGTCSETDKNCPAGSKCEMGSIRAGLCCDIKNEEEWEKERNPKCKSGTLLMKKEWYGDTVHLGRSCSHKFCPKDYKCIQTKRLAHCCSGR
ncbi:unnamed protein product [Strongylus vulgaris]|uniref:BPTI/Kunitz inhibitor domain-containing protein n=1 Tax=Strongylus vulgaris TaxID=40348 RepID=A0A3P7LTN1_STRVU|nr:unnamed protein product [Strongylus vulgaris]